MQHFAFGRRFLGRLSGGLALLIALAMAVAGIMGFQAVSLEAGPLEMAQEYLLLAAAAMFALAAWQMGGAGRMASVGAAMLALVFLLRELELPVTGSVTGYLNSDLFRWHEALAVLLVAAPYLALRWRHLGEHLRFVRSGHGWPFAAIAVLLVAADTMEGVALATPFLHVFAEELLETCAYLIFAAGAAQVLSGSLQTREHEIAYAATR